MKNWLALCFLFLGLGAQASEHYDRLSDVAVKKAVDEMCDKSVALLGEATHGDGVTFEIKSSIVRDLVERCGYNTFIIESGIYDGLEIRRRQLLGETLTPLDIKASISGLWSKTREFSPLIDFLSERLNASEDFYFGGMDDQLTSSYATGKMASDLVQGECLTDLLQFTSLKYYLDRNLFTAANEKRLKYCLDQAGRLKLNSEDNHKLAMIRNLQSLIDRNFQVRTESETADLNQRDQVMYQNFQWILSQRPTGSKVIVWAASSHNAKSMNSYWEGYKNFGNYVHEAYGDQAFSLAFTAYSGRAGSKISSIEVIPEAHEGSLEAKLNDSVSSFVFVSSDTLKKFGRIPARPLGYVFKEQNWSDLFDGIFWIRTEYPPTY